MKFRSFVSLIATMVITTGALGAAEIYNKDGSMLSIFGNISGGHYFSKSNVNNGGNAFVRYGLIGKTYVNDKVMGFGVWEHELPLNNVEEGINLKDNGRSLIGYVGVKLGELGSIDYGRNYGLLHDVISWTDLTPEFGGGDISISDNFLSGRASNVITYRNENLFSFLDGFNFAVQYQGKNDVGRQTGRTVKTANGEGYGVSASYRLKNGIAASAAYSNSQRVAEQKNLDSTYITDNIEAYSFGIKYDAHGLYVAATYGETYNMTPFGNFYDTTNPEHIFGFVNKGRNLGVVAKYRFVCGLIPLVSYVHSKASDIDNGYGNYLKKCVTVGTTYLVNNNIAAIVDYRLNLLTKNDFSSAAKICTDDILALGISYLF